MTSARDTTRSVEGVGCTVAERGGSEDQLPADASVLRVAIVAERDSRLAAITAVVTANVGSRKRRIDDKGKRKRGSKRRRRREE